MKIISQSADQLVLKEGSASGIAIGVVFVIAGALGGYFLHHSSPLAIWIALAVVLLGLAVVLFSASITVDANKATGRISYQKKRLIGGQSSTWAIADVFRIETRKQWRVQNSPPTALRTPHCRNPCLCGSRLLFSKTAGSCRWITKKLLPRPPLAQRF